MTTTFSPQKVASLIRKKGVENRKEEKKERNNNNDLTAERINYINNIIYYIVYNNLQSYTAYTSLTRQL